MGQSAEHGGSRVIIGNRYSVDLDHPVGIGGMAMVYQGFDLQSRRTIALKTLRTEYQRDPNSRARFRREARAMAFVNHPNLVTIYDLYEEQDGSWVVMEYVDGETLKELVQREGPLPPESVALILQQVANALGHIHERNMVHLDIKPQNIMITASGEVKIIDFGLAQPPGARIEAGGGIAFGTVAYLAPEQARGDAVGVETDVYSVGCVVYELLTGQLPFDIPEGPEQKRQLMYAHLEELPVAPSNVCPELELPAWVDDVVGWTLVKNPSDRIHDVRTVARLFRAGLEGEEIDDAGRTTVLEHRAGRQRIEPSHRLRLRWRERVAELDGADEDAIPELREDRSGPLGRLYRRGGRLARRSRRTRRFLWRLFLVMLTGTLLLGLILFLRRGPEALVENFLSVAPGTETTVVVDRLNIRGGPTIDARPLGVVPEGAEVRVIGLSETRGEYRFWPIETEIDGEPVSGWAWDGGLQPNEWTGRLSWVQGIVERVQSAQDSASDAWDRVTGWPLGGVIVPSEL
ncbi:MAG TPA: serine/threonine protein kinase [Thermomicrobiales bacterium]|nr:serine/threonine protein kinase [Thermomicrobiales bacterium]